MEVFFFLVSVLVLCSQSSSPFPTAAAPASDLTPAPSGIAVMRLLRLALGSTPARDPASSCFEGGSRLSLNLMLWPFYSRERGRGRGRERQRERDREREREREREKRERERREREREREREGGREGRRGREREESV